ncbi:MAG: DUF4132 domain-containing protein, partial [Bacteroidales bacterium]|nr:DUF4132 domain-containing protein [Bacteroidales bacterium]
MLHQRIEIINKHLDTYKNWLASSRSENAELQLGIIGKIAEAFLKAEPIDPEVINQMQGVWLHETDRFIEQVINEKLPIKDGASEGRIWPVDFPPILSLLNLKYLRINNYIRWNLGRYVSELCTSLNENDFQGYIKLLHKQGLADGDIIETVITHSRNPFFTNAYYKKQADKDYSLNYFAKYLLAHLQPKKNLLGLKKESEYFQKVDELIKRLDNFHSSEMWFYFQYLYFPGNLQNKIKEALIHQDRYDKKSLKIGPVLFLIEQDAAKYEMLFLDLIAQIECNDGDKMLILMQLNKKLNGKYIQQIKEQGEFYLKNHFNQNARARYYFYEERILNTPISVAFSDFLYNENKEDALKRFMLFVQESVFIYPHYLKFLDEKLSDSSVPYLMHALYKDETISNTKIKDYFPTLFEILGRYDLSHKLNEIIEFSVNLAKKSSRELACELLSKYVPDIISTASELLLGKTINHRITGTLILSNIGTKETEEILNNAVDVEINDDTRDIMLEALSAKRFALLYNRNQVKHMVLTAEKRKKLSKWGEKWLDESSLPKIYWNDTKTPLEQKEIRFLLYRMKRAKGLNSDIEAKQLLNWIDKEKSQNFAKALLNAFKESNANSKFKYYLTLSGLLGDDSMAFSLSTLFNKSIADKRVKMAEYVVGAMAMVGTNRALRNVEVIYRKFANKKPVISAAAKDALEAASSELNISIDELSDRIIPNFDFEGTYKRFEVDGEEYRAFIGNDFQLNFINEDNKTRKSIPPKASKEQKAEFKEIEKEVRDVIKSQSGRLEKYMLEERRWPAEEWKTFFFENPIMFVYAM